MVSRRGGHRRVKLPAIRLRNKPHGQREKKPRRGSDVKRKTPAMRRREMSAEKVASRASHRNRQIENPQNSAASFFGEKIGDEGRSDGREHRLAHANKRVANQQLRIGMSDGGKSVNPLQKTAPKR